jgi:hypothetical protein
MEDEVPRKKGRSRLIYGVNQKKWYATKVPASSIDALKQAGKVQQFQEREELFNQNRPGLMKLIKLGLYIDSNEIYIFIVGTVHHQFPNFSMDFFKIPDTFSSSSSMRQIAVFLSRLGRVLWVT